MRDLKRRQEEFVAITENMSEGFLVIDQETRVLTYNSAVLRLLYAQTPTEEGESVYALNREAGFRHCVEEALAGRRCEQLLEKDDDCRQIIASPVEQDGQIAGGAAAAGVHRQRLPRAEDAPDLHPGHGGDLAERFGEAGGHPPLRREHPPGDGAAHRAGERHHQAVPPGRRRRPGPVGDRGSVRGGAGRPGTAGSGGPAETGDHPEIVYNLCDNAIAYNRPGGSVTVTVENTAFGPRITVADTGIGIPREAQGRVFERFYRVDKSHSSGGTGLGLSIVKHGAAYLGAQVELHSEPGHGSTFILTFPKIGE